MRTVSLECFPWLTIFASFQANESLPSLKADGIFVSNSEGLGLACRLRGCGAARAPVHAHFYSRTDLIAGQLLAVRHARSSPREIRLFGRMFFSTADSRSKLSFAEFDELLRACLRNRGWQAVRKEN